MHFTWTSPGGKTLGLVGLGEVGRFVVPRAQSFGLEIVYTKRERLSPLEEEQLGLAWMPELDSLLEASDFVSIQATYNESTHEMIGERELALLGPTAFLINTARGRIIHEPSLIEALRMRTIAGAGLDVFLGEPPVTTNPEPNEELLHLENVVLTPHIGGQAEDSLGAIARSQAENLVAMIRGQRPPDLRNAEVFHP
jgi:glyoxylate reductase